MAAAMCAVPRRRPNMPTSTAICGSSVVMNGTSETFHPDSVTLPCSMSLAISKMLASSEFSAYVPDRCR